MSGRAVTLLGHMHTCPMVDPGGSRMLWPRDFDGPELREGKRQPDCNGREQWLWRMMHFPIR